jgi:hypothetical protein
MPENPRSALSWSRPAAVAIAAVALAATQLTAPARAAAPAPSAGAPGNVVVEWNQTLLSLVQTPGAQPATVHPTRDFAIMSLAVYDGVQRAEDGQPRRAQNAQTAAAAQAAHDTLTAMFPSFAAPLDQELAADLVAIPPGHDRATGVHDGAQAAAEVLADRASDGATATPPQYQSTFTPGDYRRTPPNLAAPVFTHWGAVTPFVLRTGDQFRPAAPPALTSRAYAAAVNEVQRLGEVTSRRRTPEQTVIGQFWSAPIQNYWNAIADELILARHSDVAGSARTLALLDLGVADATIALYDGKYAYRLWRPITAIRLADTDGNPRTHADPNWTPLATTPADPSYPGAHSVISATAATVLGAAFGDRVSFTVTSPTLPGVSRSFDSLRDAADEAGLSRIYAGVHTRLDHAAGLTLGDQVGQYTLRNALDAAHS